jgi:Rieske Fe-S protein
VSAAEGGLGRRRLLAWLASALGAALGVALAVPAAAFLTFPARRRTVSGADEPIDVAALASLPEGEPARVPVRVPRWRDAWSALTGVTLGAVWLRRSGDSVQALSTVCPHTGCAVDWTSTNKQYQCPCHDSVFDASGARVSGPAPRGMDALDATVLNGRVRIAWRRYRPGVPDREPV